MALVFILVTSCASLSVKTDFDRSVDFSKYKTFSFYPLVDKSGAVSEFNKKRIISALKLEMEKKGFKEVTNNPDVFINVTTLLAEKQSVTTTTNVYAYGGYYRPYRWGGGYGAIATTDYDTYNYKEGSLIVDVINGASKELVWQAIGNKEIDKPVNDADKAIQTGITKIMENFPPDGAKK